MSTNNIFSISPWKHMLLVLISTPNICFCGEIRKIFTRYPPLSRHMSVDRENIVPVDIFPKNTFGHVCLVKIKISLHLDSLTRIFPGCILDSQRYKVSSCGQQRLVRLHGWAGWFKSLLVVAHVRRCVFHVAIQIMMLILSSYLPSSA